MLPALPAAAGLRGAWARRWAARSGARSGRCRGSSGRGWGWRGGRRAGGKPRSDACASPSLSASHKPKGDRARDRTVQEKARVLSSPRGRGEGFAPLAGCEASREPQVRREGEGVFPEEPHPAPPPHPRSGFRPRLPSHLNGDTALSPREVGLARLRPSLADPGLARDLSGRGENPRGSP
ncbi:hypothetical protein DK412_24170 [Methylobacterium sp. 17Sr1-1]|nr:hypothetical protein DK412_24170 [Methylobacterium sp. 17Sr1-1]